LSPGGKGQSRTYLAAVVLSGEKVVVSTATIVLQRQLLAEDLPPLKRLVSEFLGYPKGEGVSYAVMNGRLSFSCGSHRENMRRKG